MANSFSIEAIPKTTVVVVAGPTASGKSNWAMVQAEKDHENNRGFGVGNAGNAEFGSGFSGPASGNAEAGNAGFGNALVGPLQAFSDQDLAMGMRSIDQPPLSPDIHTSSGPFMPVSNTDIGFSPFMPVSNRDSGSFRADPTAFNLSLQPRTGSRIINGDSMLLYQGLDLLTAMPSAQDQNRMNHDLYGFLGPYSENYCVAQWMEQAHQSVDQAHTWGQRAWIVGGSGFYLKTLTEGLSPMPVLNPDDKAALRQSHGDSSIDDLKKMLAPVDPLCAEKILDKQRLLHAWIVYRLTGHPLSWWHRQARIPSKLNFFRVLIWPSRDRLLERAEKRWESMVQHGVYDQVRSFCSHAQWDQSPLRQAIGVSPIYAMLQGHLSETQCRQQYLIDIAQYIKRQRTWFRGQFSPDYVCDAENGRME